MPVRPGDRPGPAVAAETRRRGDTFDGPLDEASAPLSVAIRLADDVDSVAVASWRPSTCRPREAKSRRSSAGPAAPLTAGRRYRFQQTSRSVRAIVTQVAAASNNGPDWDDAASELGSRRRSVFLTLTEPDSPTPMR